MIHSNPKAQMETNYINNSTDALGPQLCKG